MQIRQRSRAALRLRMNFGAPGFFPVPDLVRQNAFHRKPLTMHENCSQGVKTDSGYSPSAWLVTAAFLLTF